MDLSVLWKKDEWWAVWLGFLILALVAGNIIPSIPKIYGWVTSLNVDIIGFVLLGFGLMMLTSVAVACVNRGKLKAYLTGFPLVFLLAFFAHTIAKQETVSSFGFAYALWALFFGLIIGNTIKIPAWLREAARTELFIKIGLVVLGAEILFNVILQAGALGMFEVLVGLAIVWYFCYYLATKLGLTKTFAATLANATSVCGVSAAIAANSAVKGDPKELSYTISLVLLFSAPMIFLMPIIGKLFGMSQAVFGAWAGGTIDNTASVIACGTLYGQRAMEIASVLKLSQNILIGITAFLLATYWVFKEKKHGADKPKPVEIWYRFPKFILGFMIASLVFSFILQPTLGVDIVAGILKTTKSFRKWFFALTFVSIGLSTRFKDLAKIGKSKPLIVFFAATIFDVVLSLFTAYIFFGGTIFPSP